MTTITLNENLNQHLNAIAQQTHTSIDEVVEGIFSNEGVLKELIINYLAQKKASPLLTDVLNELPKVTCFDNQDPLELQREWRDEWN